MRTARLALALGLGLLVIGCGDNLKGDDSGDDDPTVDAADPDAPPPDAPPPDAAVCAAREAGEVGGACDDNADCDSTRGSGDGYCWEGTVGALTYPPAGFCTIDNEVGDVCVTDADCGDGNVCVEWLDFSPYKSCFPACGCDGAADACPPGQACFDRFAGNRFDKAACVPGNAEAADGDACGGFFECDERSTCWRDTLEYPGGECQRYGCTLGDDSTCNGGICVEVDLPFTGNTCVVGCDTDADCRQAEGYVCHDPDGDAGDADKYCRHPRVGDACADAGDCGGASWTCQTGGGFDDGYCTVLSCPTAGATTGCTPGSVCHDPVVGADPNYCVDRCEGTPGTQGSCRDGYLCIDTDPAVGTTTLGCVPAPI